MAFGGNCTCADRDHDRSNMVLTAVSAQNAMKCYPAVAVVADQVPLRTPHGMAGETCVTRRGIPADD